MARGLLLRSLAALAVGLALVAPIIWLGSSQTAQVSWIPPTTVDQFQMEIIGRGSTGSAGVTGSLWLSRGVVLLALLGCWPWGRGREWLRPAALLAGLARLGRWLYPRAVPLRGVMLGGARSGPNVGSTGTVAPGVGWRLGAVAAVVAIGLVVGLPEQRASRGIVVPREPDVRGAADVAAADGQAGDLIGYHGQFPWWSRTAMTYYLPDGRELPVLFLAVTGQPATFTSGCAASIVGSSVGSTVEPARCLSQVRRLWLVNARTSADPFDRMEPALTVELKGRFEVVRVTRLQGVALALLVTQSAR